MIFSLYLLRDPLDVSVWYRSSSSRSESLNLSNRCFFCAQYYRGYDKLDGDDSLYFTPNFDSLASLPPPISRFAFPFVFGIWNGDLIGLESGCARHQFVVVVPYNLSWVHMCMRTNAVRSHCESIRRKILATLRILFVRFREKDG